MPPTTNEPDGALAAAGQVLYGLATEAVRRIPRDMSLTSLATLSTLDRTGPRRITDLALVEGVAQPSMTTLVTNLQRDGLVERRSDPSDGRVALVEITPSGTDLLRARRRAGAESITELIGKLQPAEAAALAAAVPALEHLRELGNEQRDHAVARLSGEADSVGRLPGEADSVGRLPGEADAARLSPGARS